MRTEGRKAKRRAFSSREDEGEGQEGVVGGWAFADAAPFLPSSSSSSTLRTPSPPSMETKSTKSTEAFRSSGEGERGR